MSNINVHKHILLRTHFHTQDDIRVTPKTILTYVEETRKIENIVGKNSAEDFNVGVVRYEYNYPPQVEIDDKTRHGESRNDR